jgi:hypothetical protein
MSNKQLRNTLRVAHIVVGVVMMAVIYIEPLRNSPLLTVAQIIIPLVVISGVAMWQQAALSKLRRQVSAKTG